MPNHPSSKDIIRLVVEGTESILEEARRRFGEPLRPYTKRDEADLMEAWAVLSEVITRHYIPVHPKLGVPVARLDSPRLPPRRDPETRSGADGEGHHRGRRLIGSDAG